MIAATEMPGMLGISEELQAYIEQIHNEPFHLLLNNCMRKSIKIFRKCKKLGYPARLIIGPCITPRIYCLPHWIILHAYVEICGERIDVACHPARERQYYGNYEVKIYLPVIICRCNQ